MYDTVSVKTTAAFYVHPVCDRTCRNGHGPPSQTAGGCQFSSIKLQKLENPFALCPLHSLSTVEGHVPRAPAPLQHGVK